MWNSLLLTVKKIQESWAILHEVACHPTNNNVIWPEADVCELWQPIHENKCHASAVPADVYDDDDDVWFCVFPSNNALLSPRSAARHIMQLSKLTMNNRQFAGPPQCSAHTNRTLEKDPRTLKKNICGSLWGVCACVCVCASVCVWDSEYALNYV